MNTEPRIWAQIHGSILPGYILGIFMNTEPRIWAQIHGSILPAFRTAIGPGDISPIFWGDIHEHCASYLSTNSLIYIAPHSGLSLVRGTYHQYSEGIFMNTAPRIWAQICGSIGQGDMSPIFWGDFHKHYCEVRRPVGEKSVILILRKNRPVQHTSEI
jgi:hypothetical protein